jgi:ribosomal RNA-processing protein 12
VFGLFSQNLKKSRNARGSTDASSTISMTLDILVLLLPHLSTQDASELFDAMFSEEVLVNPDNAVQKRAYKILARLVEGGKLPIDVERLFKQLDEVSEGLSAAAKKVILTISHTWNVTHLVSMHHTGSITTICELTSFDPSFNFTYYPITDS